MLETLAMKVIKIQDDRFGLLDSFLIEAFLITEKDLQALTQEKLKNYVLTSLLVVLVGTSLLSHWVLEMYALLITVGIILLGWLKIFAILYIRSKMRQQ